jgi:hypothetical protein
LRFAGAKKNKDCENYVRVILGSVSYNSYFCYEHSVRNDAVSLHSKQESNIKLVYYGKEKCYYAIQNFGYFVVQQKSLLLNH